MKPVKLVVSRVGYTKIICIPLLKRGENVLCVVVVVLVQRVVFHSRSNEPRSLCGFNKKASTSRDGGTVAAIEIVVSGPAPHVFDVGGGGACQMEKTPGSLALIGRTTTIGFNLATRCPTNSEVGVEEANVAGVGPSNINFHL